jgi:hypothetical protein
MGQKKTRKLLKKILTNDNKRSMYSPAELMYMEKHLDIMLLQKQRQKLSKKGFDPTINNE